MTGYGDILEDFNEEKNRILSALKLKENRHIIMRLLGALAFYTHCPEYGYIQDALGRKFTDIDFASYSRFFRDIVHLLQELGYEEDKMVTRLFGEHRLLFHDPEHGRHIDVFFDRLEFCHTIPLKDRLEVDEPTLPLAELMLEKMQIYHINEKDLIDSIMLLREHPVGDHDRESINYRIICRLTSNDWGLWKTVTKNLNLLDMFLEKFPQLNEEDRKVIHNRIVELKEHIDNYPKTLRWKLRGLIGERIKWYKDVEELTHR